MRLAPEIAESYRLDPRPGSLFTMAECFAKAGKTASAVARYEDYLSAFGRMTPEEQSKQHGRDATAQQKRDALKPHVPLLTMKHDPSAPEGTTVTRDVEALGRAILGVALPVDPGPHTVSTQAPGAAATSQSVTLAPDAKQELVLKVLAAGNPSGPVGAQPTASGPNPGAAPIGPALGPGNPTKVAAIRNASPASA